MPQTVPKLTADVLRHHLKDVKPAAIDPDRKELSKDTQTIVLGHCKRKLGPFEVPSTDITE